MASFLAIKGARVLANGFEIVPITPGEKFPLLKGWRTVKATPALIERWLKNGHANDGIGIRTTHTPLIDIDVLDKDIGDRVQDFIETHLGFAPVRFGNGFKRGMLFRTETPFTKILSTIYIDPRGRKSQIEILGEGQQFVAFHIHPNTKKPYHWERDDSPENNSVDDLPVLTEADARKVVTFFEQTAEEAGWHRQSTAVTTVGSDPLDEWNLDAEPLGLDDDELRRKVMLIPNDDVPYEGQDLSWLNMMAAIHHETGGSDAGYDIALSWSEQSGKHEEEKGRFDKTWNSLGKRDGRQVTARLILKLAKEYEKAAISEHIDRLNEIDALDTVDDIQLIAADIRKIQLDSLTFARVVGVLQAAFKLVTGRNLPVKEARDTIRYQPTDREAPDWLDGWVYLKQVDRFFNKNTKEMLMQRAFDNAFGRFLPPDSMNTASYFALNKAKIDVFYMAAYLPIEDETFTFEGHPYVNTYSERNAPEVPAHLSERDRLNIQRVQTHFTHLLPDKREAALLTSYLAYIVQTRDRINWNIILQGVEGDGKSFFGALMSAVLGGNVRTLSAMTLEGIYTGWAVGQLFTIVEEVRLIGHSKHNVPDILKTYATNDTIDVHPKGLNNYIAPNTTSYLATTNYQNALAIDDNDSRWLVLSSQWQDKATIDEFKRGHPTYYSELFNTRNESPGALRGWLLSYKLHPDFDPKGRTPFSHGHRYMIDINKSDNALDFADILKEGQHIDVSNDLLIVSSLKKLLMDDSGGVEPSDREAGIMLRDAGFKFVCRIRINGNKESIWSKKPEQFPASDKARSLFIHRLLSNDL